MDCLTAADAKPAEIKRQTTVKCNLIHMVMVGWRFRGPMIDDPLKESSWVKGERDTVIKR